MMVSCKRERPSVGDSAEAIGGNEDLVTEILLRLPVKSLIRFKLVSKKWFSLTSSPQFARNHTRRNPNPTASGLFLYKSVPRRSSSVSINHTVFRKFNTATSAAVESVSLHHHGGASQGRVGVPSLEFVNGGAIHILQSCNGLLLCRSTSLSDGSGVSHYICNPATRQFSRLPLLSLGEDKFIVGVYLAFDPSKSPLYKAVCVVKLPPTYDSVRFEVYSSETGTWKPSGDPFRSPLPFGQLDHGVFWNGAIHWCSQWNTFLYFDIDRECLKSMPMPNLFPGFPYFGESRGHLHLVMVQVVLTSELIVFEMPRDYSGWFVKYRVDLDEIGLVSRKSVRERCSVLSVVRGENEEESSFVILIRGRVLFCSSKGTLKVLYDLPGGVTEASSYNWYNSYQYIETLSCV